MSFATTIYRSGREEYIPGCPAFPSITTTYEFQDGNYLVEAADDLVYSAVDLEDAVRKGILSWPQLRECLEGAEDDHELIKQCLEDSDQYISKRLRSSEPQYEVACAQYLRSVLIGKGVAAVADEFVKHYDALMAGSFSGELVKKSAAAPLVRACKTVGREVVYDWKGVLRLETVGRSVMHDLLDVFWCAAQSARNPSKTKPRSRWVQSYERKLYRLISSSYRHLFEKRVDESGVGTDLPAAYWWFRLCVDYVCEMTDSFALTTHEGLRRR